MANPADVVQYQKMTKADFRSDTVTIPLPEMRIAMASATVGDDVFQDDPTVMKLEADAAEMFGKEAGLFVTSGTQGNLLAMMCHCKAGDSVILGNKSHTFTRERGGVSTVAGLLPWQIPMNDHGIMDDAYLKHAIADSKCDRWHVPPATLICVENTYNGIPLPLEYMNYIGDVAKKNDMKYHIDGARIFNAATALGVEVKELTGAADTVTFCLSKGLCAPIGSVLVGPKEFILKAREVRKMLGGGLRQVGVLAAAGLISLHQMSKRLKEDHQNAKLFADGLQTISGVKLLSNNTNMVWFSLEHPTITSTVLLKQLAEKDILFCPCGPNLIRVVCHYWITAEMVKMALENVKTILQQ